MKKLVFIALATFLNINLSYGQLYLGGGPSYFIPSGPLAQTSDNQLGLNVQLENRYYCNLWWGIRVEYFDFDRKLEPFDRPYIEDYLTISPNVKVNFSKTSIIGDNTCNGKLIPYINFGLIASISSTNQTQTDKFGLGLFSGLGVSYGFTIAKMCTSLDVYGSFISSNLIYRDEARSEANGLILGLILSVRL